MLLDKMRAAYALIEQARESVRQSPELDYLSAPLYEANNELQRAITRLDTACPRCSNWNGR